MKLGDIAHSRAGDKGNISNISLIPYEESDYAFIRDFIDENYVKDVFKHRLTGPVIRYELPKIFAFNFVLSGALLGGVTRSLASDPHGKTLSSILLNAEIDENLYHGFRDSL